MPAPRAMPARPLAESARGAGPDGGLRGARYAGVPADPGGRAGAASGRRRAALLGAALGLAAAAAAVARGWPLQRPRQLASQRGGQVLLAQDKGAPPRTCLELPGLPVAEGRGRLESPGGEEVDGDRCTEACRGDEACEQLIFQDGRCSLFKRAATDLAAAEPEAEEAEEPRDTLAAFCGGAADEPRLWFMRGQLERQQVQRDWDKAEGRAKYLLGQLSLEDKVALLHGQNEEYPNDRRAFAGLINASRFSDHGIMALGMNDGPQGFNHYQGDVLAGSTTQFPCLLALAAAFDPGLAWQYADAIAEEFVGKGSNVLLGPDIEVTRAPLTGRSFESLSGEDPFLGAELVRPFVQAVQARGVIATVKHWLNNNQEIYRMTMNSEVGRREQFEIYMPPFRAAFEAGAGGVMCAYNRVNGVHACESEELLHELLRQELGFRGFVVSDWGATHDAENSVKAGLDIEMQGGADDEYHKIPGLVEKGKVSEEQVDQMAGHVLSAMFAAGQFDGRFPEPRLDWTPPEDPNEQLYLPPFYNLNVSSDEHRRLAQQAIIDGAVLLKNDGPVLPLEVASKRIALIGRYCNQVQDASYGQGDVFSGGGSGYVQTSRTITPLQGLQDGLQGAEITWGPNASDVGDAEVAVVCASGHSEEGWDREEYALPEAASLVSGIRGQSADVKIVVLAIAPGAITTEWAKEADAVLVLFMPGEQVGPALARLLTGDASPGGRLPVSFPAAGEQRLAPEQYPGTCPPPDTWCEDMTANFTEGVLVGYRWNDAAKVPAAYPFGYGLTYTEFELRGFAVARHGRRASVSFRIANTGGREGAAVPQVYVGFPSLKPVVRQLRGFQKLRVQPGEEVQVAFVLRDEDWSYYDAKRRKWVSALDKGENVTLSVGTSSADLVWHHELTKL